MERARTADEPCTATLPLPPSLIVNIYIFHAAILFLTDSAPLIGRAERKDKSHRAHERADIVAFATRVFSPDPEDDIDESEWDRFDDVDDLEKILEYRGLEAHPTHTPAQRAAMSHDDQWKMFSEVRPVKSVAEADMLWRRWEEELGPEVIQFWRSCGWIPQKWMSGQLLVQAKVLKAQDRKIRVSAAA